VVRDIRLTLTPLSIDFDSKTGPIDPSERIKSQISCRYRSWEKVLDNSVVVTNPAENLSDKTNKDRCFETFTVRTEMLHELTHPFMFLSQI